MPFNTSISYSELDGSPEETLTEDGQFEVERTLLCAWSDRWTLARDLRGYWTYDNVRDVAVRHSPQPYPHATGVSVESVGMKGFGRIDADADLGTAVAAYEGAVLAVHYALPEDKDPNDEEDEGRRLYRERLEPSVEFIQMEPRLIGWGVDEPIDPVFAPKVQMRSLTWIIEREHLPRLATSIKSLIGYVNSDAIVSPTLGFNFAAETLLYEPPDLSREATMIEDAVNVGLWHATFTLHYQSNGWNKFPKNTATGIEWGDLINYVTGEVMTPYPSAVFSTLLDEIFAQL